MCPNSNALATEEPTTIPTEQPTNTLSAEMPTKRPITVPSCVASATAAAFYNNQCSDPDGCVFIKDQTLRATTTDCYSSCQAGYSGSTCYGCIYDSSIGQSCILLLGKPFAPPCLP